MECFPFCAVCCFDTMLDTLIYLTDGQQIPLLPRESSQGGLPELQDTPSFSQLEQFLAVSEQDIEDHGEVSVNGQGNRQRSKLAPQTSQVA